MSERTSGFRRSDALRIGGTVVILGVMAMVLPVRVVLRQMRNVPPTTWVAALGIFMVIQLLGAVKFRLILRSAGAALPLALSVRCYFAALFGNVFLPSIVGGDVISIGLAMRYSTNRAAVAVGALVNRLLDFAALACMTVIGTILLHACRARIFELPIRAK